MGKVGLICHTIFLLCIIQNTIVVFGADPTGSTGCSKKFFLFDSARGWCWRHCQGSSGKWCYTSQNCVQNEEKCAADTKCSGDRCTGAAEGCVTSCPTPSSPEPQRIGEPVGSTGCSKRFSEGYCWRHCTGSSGSWCYTNKGCVGDEEKCARHDTCGEISCEGAAPGCVFKCHDTQCLRFIKHKEGRSTFYSLQISADSRKLSENPEVRPYVQEESSVVRPYALEEGSEVKSYAQDEGSEVKSYVQDDGSEVKSYVQEEGSEYIIPQQWSNQSSQDEGSESVQLRNRKKRTSHFTSLNCWADPHVDYGYQQVLEGHIRDLEQDPLVVPERPMDLNNPIEVVYRRPIQVRNWFGMRYNRHDENGNAVTRPEVLVAEIHPRHLNPNNYNNFPGWSTNYMRNQLDAESGDIRFHLVANVLGGPPQLYNMVPGHTSVNNNVGTPQDTRRNDWPSVERAMRNHLQTGNGNYVRWYVGLYYDDTETGRPTHFTYLAILIYGNGNRINIFGSSENRQLP